LKRRKFLQLGTVFATVVANRLYAAVRAIRMRVVSTQSQVSSVKKLDAGNLLDVVAGKTVLLGSRDSRDYYVSVDDIAEDRCFNFAISNSNALVISAYNRNDFRDGALQRAVLSKLRYLSPDDYKAIDAVFNDDNQMQPGRLLSFELKIPDSRRSSFPVDYLIVAVFEVGPSGSEEFGWVKTTFEITAQKGARTLIVPCLGRDWRDKRTIEFEDYFKAFLDNVPLGDRPAAVHFSLYTQWPSFELEDAVRSLNRAWKRAVV
jgi:hypothetical protein